MNNEFPKMATVTIGSRITPLVFPPGHLRHGEYIIFQNADEERAYEKSNIGVPASLEPEMVGKPTQYPVYRLED